MGNRAILFSIALLLGLLGCSGRQTPTSKPGETDKTQGEAQMATDLKFVDDYLAKWDRFSQGENELVPYIRDNKDSFESTLARILEAKDKRGPARMVFYAVVQVGGSIPLDSDLGKASADALGGPGH
jgi:hypothetical protein